MPLPAALHQCAAPPPLYSQPVTVLCYGRRDQYGRKITEQENLGKALREKQKTLRDGQESSAAQVRMWRDVERLIDMKRRLAAGGGDIGGGLSSSDDYYGAGSGGGEPAGLSKRGGGVASRADDEDRLVL